MSKKALTLRPVAVLIGWTAKDCCFYDMTLFEFKIFIFCVCDLFAH